MTKALLIIDYTNDFVADDGTLTVGKPAQQLDGYLTALADRFYQNGDVVLFPTDAHHLHAPFHPESKLFPPHNIIGTSGRNLYGQVGDWYQAHRASDRVDLFAKNRYSSFANTNLDNYLRERRITDLWISGVCTDICVLHTAIDAYNRDYQVTIPRRGVATFTAHGDEWAFDHFQNSLGATVVD
ncbi:isochorismatase family cysteine hydrolase [Limosilactobacillus pontis]|uniref:Cysteine hydrolase n=1 Tax=Limosilactobacillus pontis TaxID=35787 RepID=A0ABU7SRR3_9LACO